MIKNSRNIFLTTMILLLLLSHTQLGAQPFRNGWYLNKIVNDNSGLPQNSINDIYYDPGTNFLWISTNGGIVRYDGMGTKVFSPRNFPGLSTGRIGNFMPTLDNKVLGTDREGQFFKIVQTKPVILPVNAGSAYANYFKTILNLKDAGDFIKLNKLFEEQVKNEIAKKYTPPDSSFWFTTAYLNDSTLAMQTDLELLVFNNNHIICNFSLPANYLSPRTMVPLNNMVYVLESNMGNFYCLDWGKTG